MVKDNYLGLDMGTSSVGWAVTDENYNLLRAKGKDLWGIREFDEASTAAERRMHRVSRRRHQREQVRIGLLKSYFDEAITQIDAQFFQRLENSKYHLEDKDEAVRDINGIFNDDGYTDKEYFKEYPTIFHLRKELLLCEKSKEHDVRLVYLALLNMFKHRGHFLNASLDESGSERSMEEVYQEFVLSLSDISNITFSKDIDVKDIEKILSSRDYNRTRKCEECANLLGINLKDKIRVTYLKAICGLKVNVQLLFEDIILDNDKKLEFCFSDIGFEDIKIELEEILGEERYRIIELMKEIYDIGSLAGIMKGYTYLSEARVAEYEKHKKDLSCLKKVIRTFKSKEDYDFLFREDKDGTYSAYVGSVNSSKKSRRNVKGRKSEDLYKTIKKLLKDVPKNKEVIYIENEIDKETFLPKQLTSSNGVIPNQVHRREMKKILDNAKKHLSFLEEIDESGLSVADRIYKLFTFQIPYYIGPTSTNSKTGWVVRKEEGQVLPWNINEKIDVNKTSEEFIRRLVRRCTYIDGYEVLPKSSLEYESFCVLNEINNIKLDGERMSVELKQAVFNELFKSGKRISKKKLVDYFIGKGIIEDESQVSGMDININSSLSSYGKFKAIFGDKIEEDTIKHMIEEIIRWCTIYGDSKSLLLERLEQYRDILSPEQIKRISGYKFRDWGNLSKEFLELQGCDKSDGEVKSLIRMMWDTNYNMMELINDSRYTYKEELLNRQAKSMKALIDIQPEDLEDYYFSAPVKRMIWQTILIIRELTEVLGAPPKRLFVEMTRKPDEKKQRTISRKQKFLDLYKSVKKEEQDWRSVIENADNDGTLRSKKMYLYLTQKGRCMYTGKVIELKDLFNDNIYDIDHIYPRHYVKDDNIDNNLVLVYKPENARKSDDYPLDANIYNSQRNMWRELRAANFINEEKYNRLISRNSFTDEQKAGFIARQLVETSQGVKGVTEILKQILPETMTKIVYSKASNVSEFRQSRKLPKSRLVNEFHHAQDAYLNIVVGNVYFVKFTQNPYNFIMKEYNANREKHKYHLSKMFDWDVARDKEVAWVASRKDGEPGTVATVRKVMSKNTPLMTRYNYEGHGGLADETLFGAKKASKESYIPLKANDIKMQDVTRYGGFSSVSTAYFFLVEHEVKGKRVRTIEFVPIYLKAKVEKSSEEIIRYCIEHLQLVNPRICVKKIKMQSLLMLNGYFAYISGRTGNRIILRNATNMCLSTEWLHYIKKLEKYGNSAILDDAICESINIKLYKELEQKFLCGIYKNRPNPVGEKLVNGFERFISLDINEQCKVLLSMLSLSMVGGNGADLSLIGEGSATGKTRISKNISSVNEILLINQSVTGLFENKIDLLTV
ncbi:MAG: type II CRISPR RNA-guided endonuclease Cas9 [Lachnospiraceae bacterium]|nr:type II CRISPR RNA-guided endonuclease Cas9 [Lachnospiraceae bacterium]